jgi:glycine/D-amino acid oxidase-like deaminating enzyme
VELTDEAVEADAVVIAMGPWSARAAGWLPLPQVYGLKGHSLVFGTGDATPAEAVFLEHLDGDGRADSPEIYPRDDGTTYVCAISSEPPLPGDPAGVRPDAGAPERLEAICRSLSPVLAQSPVLARQACFRPVTRDGLPLMGRVPGFLGAYVATGHSVWGMLNAPASGEAMAELILDGGASKVDLAAFDPGRLAAARP